MIETIDLRVDYEDVQAVRDLALTVPRGEVYGLIGPNGAGKTSTMRVLAGLQEMTYGRVFIGGMDLTEKPERVHRIIGYMPDFAPVYEDLRVWEFLDLFAHAYGLDAASRRRRVDAAIAVASLGGKRDAMCKGLSRGMRQRLVLGKTMLHDPELYLLDEPASGLDPQARIELRDALKALAARGKTVVVSSHILTELSGFCTSIGIMREGRLVLSGPLDEVMRDQAPHRQLVIETVGGVAIDEVVARSPAVREVRVEGRRAWVALDGDDDEAAALLASLIRAGVRVSGFYEQRPDVEALFLQTGREGASS